MNANGDTPKLPLSKQAASTVSVVFLPAGRRGQFPLGTPALTAARRLGVDIDSVCGGRGICGRCQIEVGIGSYPKLAIESSLQHLSAPNAAEIGYKTRRELKPGRRLSCCAQIIGDVVIDVPAESQIHRQWVRKGAETHPITLAPLTHLHYLEVAPPALDPPKSDWTRLTEALQGQWNISGVTCSLSILQQIPEALIAGKGRVTLALFDGAMITAIWPGFQDHLYGLAIDIGSTTLALHLCDLQSGAVLHSAGRMNPQIRYGEDLMSRISYAMMHPDGAREMTEAVRIACNALIDESSEAADIPRDHIVEAVMVGNPVMHHLFLGLSPVSLGTAPFTLHLDREMTLAASEVGLALSGAARVHFLPLIAGHVGADCAAVILAEAPHRSSALTLIVDVGTNAEIVLGNQERLLAASSPTGPAFEGAQISSGQRAAPGAIERVRIDPETLEPRYRIIGCEAWSDEPGFDEAASQLGVTGICGSGIIEAVGEMYLAGIVSPDGLIQGALTGKTPRIVADGRTYAYVLKEGDLEIRITQNDIRAIQLAKAALYAGARLLMDAFGADHVDRIVLAGAFGSHIDPLYAMLLGMIPDCDLSKVSAAGNAAGTGARIALLNKEAREEIATLVPKIEKIETALAPAFQQHFIEAMAIPHKTAAYPHLAARVTLPSLSLNSPHPSRPMRRRGTSPS